MLFSFQPPPVILRPGNLNAMGLQPLNPEPNSPFLPSEFPTPCSLRVTFREVTHIVADDPSATDARICVPRGTVFTVESGDSIMIGDYTITA